MDGRNQNQAPENTNRRKPKWEIGSPRTKVQKPSQAPLVLVANSESHLERRIPEKNQDSAGKETLLGEDQPPE
jgi:hypothetical protein